MYSKKKAGFSTGFQYYLLKYIDFSLYNLTK